MNKRPLGVTLLCAAIILLGLYTIYALFWNSPLKPELFAQSIISFPVYKFISILKEIIEIACAVLMFRGMGKARYVYLATRILGSLLVCIAIPSTWMIFLPSLIGLTITGFILFRPAAKAFFENLPVGEIPSGNAAQQSFSGDKKEPNYIIVGLLIVLVIGFITALYMLNSFVTKTVPLIKEQAASINSLANQFAESTNMNTEPDNNPNLFLFDNLHSQSVAVSFIPPTELDNRTKENILDLRKKMMHPFLPYMKDNAYVPFDKIYEQITDNKSWWGWDGLVLYGAGDKANAGNSFRSNAILNPLALIVPDFWEQGLRNSGLLDLNKIAASPAGFPLQPAPTQIVLNPADHSISVHYNVTAYNAALAPYLTQPMPKETIINLEAINARDMGYPVVFFDYKSSSQITKENPIAILTKTMEFYHTGTSCGYPGGCNNLSPRQEALFTYVINQLPAKAEFKLWRQMPKQVSDKEDITYRIYFD